MQTGDQREYLAEQSSGAGKVLLFLEISLKAEKEAAASFRVGAGCVR
jgi:hypothetical protein